LEFAKVSKRSNEKNEPLDLERDLPTTAEDVRALRRLKHFPQLDSRAYVEFLGSLPPATEPLDSRKGPTGDLPFTL
jgi:hypothetical protein